MPESVPTAATETAAAPATQEAPSVGEQFLSSINDDVFPDAPSAEIAPEAEGGAEPAKVEEVKTEEPAKEEEKPAEDFDPLANPEQPEPAVAPAKSSEMEAMEKHIGELSNKIGELTAQLTKKEPEPEQINPAELLAGASIDDIQKNMKLPEGMTPDMAKFFGWAMQQSLKASLKDILPQLGKMSEYTNNAELVGRLAAKHEDFVGYGPRITKVVQKHYPQGVPAEQREKVYEQVYEGLKKYDKAKGLADAGNAKNREKTKSALGKPNNPTPPAAPAKKDFLDRINEGVFE